MSIRARGLIDLRHALQLDFMTSAYTKRTGFQDLVSMLYLVHTVLGLVVLVGMVCQEGLPPMLRQAASVHIICVLVRPKPALPTHSS